jgi:hypothetical protein
VGKRSGLRGNPVVFAQAAQSSDELVLVFGERAHVLDNVFKKL